MRVMATMVPATPLMNAASLATIATSTGPAWALTVRACCTFLHHGRLRVRVAGLLDRLCCLHTAQNH